MADLRPFKAILPKKGLEDKIAALPYDVYNREEATKIVKANPLSFLCIDRAETNFPDNVSTYDECVYQKAEELLSTMILEGQFVEESKQCYFLYRLVRLSLYNLLIYFLIHLNQNLFQILHLLIHYDHNILEL